MAQLSRPQSISFYMGLQEEGGGKKISSLVSMVGKVVLNWVAVSFFESASIILVEIKIFKETDREDFANEHCSQLSNRLTETLVIPHCLHYWHTVLSRLRQNLPSIIRIYQFGSPVWLTATNHEGETMQPFSKITTATIAILSLWWTICSLSIFLFTDNTKIIL